VLGRRAAEMTLMTLAFIYPHKLTGQFLPLQGHVTQNTVPFHDLSLNEKGLGHEIDFKTLDRN
jgi:hypothetical protein